MNGNLPMDFTSRDYPQVEALKDYNALYDEVMATDATLLAADAAARAAEKRLAVGASGSHAARFEDQLQFLRLHLPGEVFAAGVPLFRQFQKIHLQRF